MTDNLRIWHAVEKTDPDATKSFNRGGGFKGTATNPTYLAERATALWGPYGIGWGMDLLSSEFREGHIFDDRGNREVVHVELWRLWYTDGDKRGEVSHYGQTTFVGTNKYGPFTDEEAPKKTKTDAMTKCLALLGFAADIHRGRFDDVKYVNDRRREEADARKKNASSEGLRDAWVDGIKDSLPEGYKSKDFANACVDQLIKDFAKYASQSGLEGGYAKRKDIIGWIEEKFPDLYTSVTDAFMHEMAKFNEAAE